ELVDRRRAAHVTRPRQGPAATLADLLRRALDVLPARLLLVVRERRGIAARARHHDVGALARQRDRGGPSDTAQPARARHDRDLAVQISHSDTLLALVLASLR